MSIFGEIARENFFSSISFLIFSLIIAVLFLGERPDWQTLCGATIIIFAGLYTFWREQIKFRQ